MTSDWTDADTEALAALEPMAFVEDPSCVAYVQRAAAEIRRLQARVAELEAAVAFQQERVRDEARAKVAGWLHAIPRATLVSALRERAALWETQSREALASRRGSAEDKRWAHNVAEAKRYECNALADEIERGEWPETKRER